MFDAETRREMRMQSLEGDRSELSVRTYNAILAAVVFYGLFTNAFIITVFSRYIMNINFQVLLIFYFVSAFAGCMISYNSSNYIVSFIGYNLVVVPVGVVLAIGLSGISWVTIQQAIMITAASSLVMLFAAITGPYVFQSMGRALFTGLCSGIICEIVAMLLGFSTGVFDWFFVILFSLYIAHDFAIAQIYPRTIDNAVDSALDLYLDIINLFIRILSIIARRDD